MKCTLRKASGHGDEILAEWDTDTITPEKLAEIEAEFTALTKKGFFAGDLVKGELVDKFDPNTNTLMIPKIQGGADEEEDEDQEEEEDDDEY